MKRMVSLLFMIVGASFLIYGGYQIWETNHAQKQSLAEAREIVSTVNNESKIEKEIPFDPQTGDTVGILSIPAIDAELPIIEGTDEDELEKGVGHYLGSSYPTENDQIVLSGHRDTVFRKMGNLEIGDVFIIKLPYGDFTYEIKRTEIVDADDRTIIHSTAPKETLVVTTCYPFTYVGNAPERYIIHALPVK